MTTGQSNGDERLNGAELRRAQWSTSGWMLTALGILLVSLAGTLGYYLWSELPDVGERSLASNLGFFLLININIIVVMILVFLVTKNIITLVLDRRRNILGSRLRARLVTAFVALSLVPTVLLFLVARGILESVLQGWFSPQIAASVDGALNVARFHSDSAQSELNREVRTLTAQLGESLSTLKKHGESPQFLELAPVVDALLKRKLEEHGLFSLAILDRDGRTLVREVAAEPNGSRSPPPEANTRAVQRATTGLVLVRPEFSLQSEYLSGYAPIYPGRSGPLRFSAEQGGGNEPAPYVLVASRLISPELGAMLSEVINAYEDYNELRTYRRPLASSYLLTLVVVTLLIVFAAIWVGFYLAKSLSVPIGLLAKGTSQVAHGNLDYRIPETGDDELSVLVRSFNVMTTDLKDTTEELVARRRYMEAVFAHVAVGVIPLDRDLTVRAVNIAAHEILGLPENADVVHKTASEVLPADLVKQLKEMAGELFATSQRTLEANVSLPIQEQLKHLRVTLTKLTDEQGAILGAVMLLDDLTELVSAQRMAAWREVARRIAHEIKNPLTPIQLCAQRIQRRFSAKRDAVADQGDIELITESTDTIVNQVENLRNLVNEFSRFARMPKSVLRPGNLNELLGETLSIYRQAHPEIQFNLHLALDLPPVDFDREQMGRVLINLLDNAVASVLSAGITENGAETAVAVQSSYDASLDLATVTISDTGLGISEQDKKRLFEPYFSTKDGGTGLGLAIASSILSDHNGFIRVRDNKPRGAVFVVELPASAQYPGQQLVNESKS